MLTCRTYIRDFRSRYDRTHCILSKRPPSKRDVYVRPMSHVDRRLNKSVFTINKSLEYDTSTTVNDRFVLI